MASSPKTMSGSGNNKKKGSFLSRQKRKSKDVVSEEDLLKKSFITPEDVLKLTTTTESMKLIPFNLLVC